MTEYCGFALVLKTVGSVSFQECTLAVTGKELFIYRDRDNPKRLFLHRDSSHPRERVLEFLFGDVRGVDLRSNPRQLQLMLDTGILALYITKDRAFMDPASMEQLFELLISKGVPRFESDDWIEDDTPVFIYYIPLF